jgi:HlyD family secretion protein
MTMRCAKLYEALMAAALAAAMLAAGCSKPAQAPGAAQTGAAPAGAAQAGAGGQARQGGAYSGAPGAGGQGGGGQAGFAGGNGRRIAAVAVQATTVPVGMLSADRDTAGVLTPVTQSQVAAAVGGIVAKVLRASGDWVSAGEVIVQLDDSLLKITAANAQAALDTAKINLQAVQDSTSQSNVKLALQVDSAQSGYDSAKKFYESQKALYDLGGISASALDTAKGQLASAQANLESAKLALDQNQKGLATTPGQNVDALKVAIQTAQNNLSQALYNLQNAAIKAPFAGQIASIAATPGMFVGQNGSAFTLVSAERQVNFNISPADTPAVPPGKKLTFELAGKTFPITVKQAPSIPINGVVSLTASIAGAGSLPFGTVGNVSYLVPLAYGTFVPINALDTLENRNFVFAIENGKAVVKDVEVLAESGSIAAVTGLNAGATVILSPPPGLLDGSQVQPTMVVVPGLATGGLASATPQAPLAGAPAGAQRGQGSGRPGAQGAAGAAGSAGAAAGGQARQYPGSGGAAGAAAPSGAAGQGAGQYQGQRGTRGGAAGAAAPSGAAGATSPATGAAPAAAPQGAKP